MPVSPFCVACLAAVAVQPVPTEEAEPEDVIVTGERVPRTLRETASSVDVSESDRIEALSGADRIEQVLEMVPNVQLGSGGEGPTIRGQDTTGVLRDLPAFLGGNRPRTTLQVDGRAVTFNEFVFGIAPLWDIERVEVFRTPQTTTQGRNSIAGAIFIHSKDPTYEWEGRARMLAGNYGVRQASAMVSGPLDAGSLAFRASADLRRGRGSSHTIDFIRDASPNQERYGLLRFKLLAEPGFWAGSRVEIASVHSEALSPPEIVRPPYKKRRDPIDRVGVFGTNIDSITAVADYPLAPELKGSTTLAFGNSYVRRFSFPGLGETRTRGQDFSVETLLDWNPQGSARVIGGLSWLRSRLDQHIDLSLGAGIGDFDDEQTSVGLFGEASFEPIPRTVVTAGLRYQQDRQQRAGALGKPGQSVALDFDRSFSAWLPKLSIAHDFSGTLRAGVLVQRAYNPGGTTLRFDTGMPEEFAAETLWNYELFLRASPSPTLRLSGNLFYTDIRNSQRARSVTFQPPNSPPIFFASITNAPRARTYGLELTADWKPTPTFSARAAVGLLDTRITRAEAPDDPADGKDFQRAPPLTASASLDWRPVERLQLSMQVRHNAGYFSDDFETAATKTGSATIADVRGSFSAGHWTLFGYVRNLFDRFELRFRSSGSDAAIAIDPREFGVGLERRF